MVVQIEISEDDFKKMLAGLNMLSLAADSKVLDLDGEPIEPKVVNEVCHEAHMAAGRAKYAVRGR